jgi:hypothetical protein
VTDRPLSDAVAAGWEIVSYSATDYSGETYQHNILLRRQGQHRILNIRKKMLGEGVVVTELEV